MKKVLVFILLAYVVSCDSVKDLQPDSPPILEITKDAAGTWEYPGKTLYLRLYSDGTIEFDYEDFRKRGKGFNKAEEVNTLERAKISPDELEKFNGILRSEGFQNVDDKYIRNLCTDTGLHYKIQIQTREIQKNIDVYICESLSELEESDPRYAEVPPLLPELLTLTRTTRTKYTPQ